MYLALGASFSAAFAASEPELVVYSARKEHLIKPLFDAYTAKNSIRIKFITDKAGPLQVRLIAEGARTPADLLITVDAGNLWRAADAGLLAAIDSGGNRFTRAAGQYSRATPRSRESLVRAIGAGAHYRLQHGPGQARRAVDLRGAG
jgi:ABC-type thiamine transport system substrate-binding protein